VHAWDFGGQEVYRITHQFFYSHGSLYLVIWKPREGSEQGEVEGWLRRIRLKVAGGGRAFVVATHCAGERRPDLDYPSLWREFPSLLAGHFEVDNSTGEGIAGLRDAIAAELAGLSRVGLPGFPGQAVSPQWIAAREEILALAATVPQIGFERFEAVCRSHGLEAGQSAALGVC